MSAFRDVDRHRVARLVEHDVGAARQRQHHGDAESLIDRIAFDAMPFARSSLTVA